MWENAIREFTKAAALTSYSRKGVNSYRAYYNIGSIYETMGDKEKAKEYYQKCGDYNNALKKLEEL